ncbi:MAG: hypothetical protein KY475_00275 [Planctomycetes bacterium]|nr:hypothetical protein [Planctomycetota bacterium]
MGWVWVTCLWPGLPRLWWRGEWAGFVVAAGFAAGLNFALVATFMAPHLVNSTGRLAGCTLMIVSWLWCVRRGAVRLSQIYGGDGRYNDELFRRAQEEYLKGQWFEAESLLLRLVREELADVEGRLILATLYRHTRRAELAESQLRQLERYPHASRWGWEIRRERIALESAIAGRDEANQALEDESEPVDGPKLLVDSRPGADAIEGEPRDDDENAGHGGLSAAA